MATTVNEIRNWLKKMREGGYTHMIVTVDTFDYEDYPVYISKNQNVREEEARINSTTFNRVMEIYSANLTDEEQLSQFRAFNYN